jgi:anti-sigma factor RsiW
MTKEQAEHYMMDYLYGELEGKELAEFEEMIRTNDDLRKELEELQETRSMLRHLPADDPSEKLLFAGIETEQQPATEKPVRFLSVFMRRSLGIAASILLLVIAGAATDMNFSAGSEGVKLSFGEQEPPAPAYTAAQIEMLISQVQQENRLLMEEYVLAAQEQQEQQFQQTLATFADYMQTQRQSDLETMNYSLTNLEDQTYELFEQTDMVLGQLIQTVSAN